MLLVDEVEDENLYVRGKKKLGFLISKKVLYTRFYVGLKRHYLSVQIEHSGYR